MLTLKQQYDIINNKCMCTNTDYNMQILTVKPQGALSYKKTLYCKKTANEQMVGKGQ